MLKQTVTYTDYNGEERTEDLYFNLTKAEIIELEMSRDGGLSEVLKRIVASENGREIMKEFKNVIMVSYGQKSADGSRFIKNQELLDGFMSSEVYSEFFMQLMTVDGAAANFIKAVIPNQLLDEVVAELGPNDQTVADAPEESNDTEVEVITKAELVTMSPNDKAAVMLRIQQGTARLAGPEDL